tara:strand:+ start:4696 stop:4941 length:246 start_codon:yes stop_codon:yes gene_type:complete
MKKLIFKIASWFGFIKSINVETIKKQNVAQKVKTKKSISHTPEIVLKNHNNKQNLSSKYNSGEGVYRDVKGRFTSLNCIIK